MTIASARHQQLEFDTAERVVEALREQGFRLSKARRIVLDALFAAEGPMSAEFIAEGLGGRFARSDLASVYRNLEWLESVGVVRHVHLGHGPGLYTLAREGSRDYLVCERCGRVESLAASELDDVRAHLRESFGFEARFSHFGIPGLCAGCVDAVGLEEAADTGSRSGKTGGRARQGRDGKEASPAGRPHSHGRKEHAHSHTAQKHKHTEHEHEHSHGDYVHCHPHAHERGLEDQHEHGHQPYREDDRRTR